jgi:hypothetical protein
LSAIAMRTSWGILAISLIAGSSISYFKYERTVTAADSTGQHYVVIDETVWRHARADLTDLRLYSAEKEIPYANTIEMGGSESEQSAVRILQPGILGGKTQFLLDMSGTVEYDRVELKLATRNFVAHARVDGQDDPHGKEWVTLGTTTLYDLSDEKLGHNSALQIPRSAYKYLRVTIDSVVKPAEVQSANAGTTRAEKSLWRDVRSEAKPEQFEKDTVFILSIPENVPVERVSFAIDPEQKNFRRSVKIETEKGQPVGAGEISRIHMQRNGQKIDVEEPLLAVRLVGPGKYRVRIRNGDDAPLLITEAQLQQYERRIYFDSGPGAQVQLYYGDDKLGAPVYDYRNLFQKDTNASPLQLEPEVLNARYRERPDERPWSERYPAVLWAAIIAAVAILGALAVRSIKSAGVS